MFTDIEQLHTLSLDASGVVVGVRKDIGGIRKLAETLSLEAILEALESKELKTLLGALFLIPYGDFPPSQTRLESEKLLTALILDPRVHEWTWGERHYQRRCFEVGVLAAEATLHLLKKDLTRRSPEVRDAAAAEASDVLVRCLSQALLNMSGPGAVDAVMLCFRQILWRTKEKGGLIADLAEVFRAAALEEGRVASLRCMAAQALHGQSETTPSEAALVFEATSKQVIGALVEVLDDEGADVRLRRQMCSLLMDIAPKKINGLQEQGRLASEPLPSPEMFLTPWGRPISDRIVAAARRVCVDDVMKALGGQDIPSFVAAACLVPDIAPRARWEELSGLLLAAMARDDWYVSEQAIDLSRAIDLGDFAADRLAKMIGADLIKARSRVTALLHRALVAVLERPVVRKKAGLDPLLRFADQTRWARRAVKEELDESYLKIAEDASATATERFAALVLLSPKVRAKANPAGLFMDSETPDALRALLGGVLAKWELEALTAHVVDPSADTWQLREDGPEDLPVCEPRLKVPMGWLLATIEMTRHIHLAFEAVRGLGQQVGGLSPEKLEATRRWLLDKSSARLRQTLLDVLDQDSRRDAPRWQAAIVLALLGESEDEGVLVEYVSNHGPWSKVDPSTDDFAALNPQDYLVLKPLAHGVAHHLLETHLRSGFGETQAERIMARSFAALGGRALRAGKLVPARRAYRMALQLDPLNLEARRASRTLAISDV